MKNRIPRVNSLLKEVISEVINKDVKNPNLNSILTVTQVEVSKDLHHAKVYISVIGDIKQKQQTLEALESAAGFIAVTASKKVVLRYFPSLVFKIDDSVDKHMRIDAVLAELEAQKKRANG
ncbi:MAG: 30S ribosome-binding factor RbfA [Rhabdochlamydiaceae bacterium]